MVGEGVNFLELVRCALVTVMILTQEIFSFRV